MSRFTLIAFALGTAALAGCANEGGQSINVSEFAEFSFSRTIQISQCFGVGDLMAASLEPTGEGHMLTYTTLTAVQEGQSDCEVVTDAGLCLIPGEEASRPLNESEVKAVEKLFANVVIANGASELCAAGNVTLCSEDLYRWDGLTASGDFCQPVYLENAFEVMDLLQDLRDGELQEPADSGQLEPFNLFELFNPATTPVEILRVIPIIASDQFLGKNGDYVVIRDQSDLDGVLFQDGSVRIDFASEIGVAVVVIRPPCQEFVVDGAAESVLTVDIEASFVAEEGGCFLDFGFVDAHVIVIPKATKKVRVFLNGSELDEVHL